MWTSRSRAGEAAPYQVADQVRWFGRGSGLYRLSDVLRKVAGLASLDPADDAHVRRTV